jgi:hypothetical protein
MYGRTETEIRTDEAAYLWWGRTNYEGFERERSVPPNPSCAVRLHIAQPGQSTFYNSDLFPLLSKCKLRT